MGRFPRALAALLGGRPDGDADRCASLAGLDMAREAALDGTRAGRGGGRIRAADDLLGADLHGQAGVDRSRVPVPGAAYRRVDRPSFGPASDRLGQPADVCFRGLGNAPRDGAICAIGPVTVSLPWGG